MEAVTVQCEQIHLELPSTLQDALPDYLARYETADIAVLILLREAFLSLIKVLIIKLIV